MTQVAAMQALPSALRHATKRSPPQPSAAVRATRPGTSSPSSSAVTCWPMMPSSSTSPSAVGAGTGLAVSPARYLSGSMICSVVLGSVTKASLSACCPSVSTMSSTKRCPSVYGAIIVSSMIWGTCRSRSTCSMP